MNRLRSVLAAVCIATTIGGAAIASAATAPATPNSKPMRQGWQDGRGGPGGEMHRLLDKLDLTAEQTAQVQAILDAARPQMHAVHQSGRAYREQLQTMPPTDPGYAALIASAKANAAEQIQLRSDLWAQVYEKLTPDQRSRIPGIVAAQRADQGPRQPRPGQPPSSP
jgi:Spy/CpxP family protein refolding chaperone